MAHRFYLTTTIPYVNADPHIGFALEIVQADAIARYRRLAGDEVFFNTGTDEHGQKVYEKALAEGTDTQVYADRHAAKFDELKTALNLSYDNFIRTTELRHREAAQEFWRRCDKAGDIYKKQYRMKYCVGCELEKTDSELVDGRCPLHPNAELEVREEENYFFKFSRYEKPLLKLFEERANFVVPGKRFNEVKSFVAGGLQDFSISRLKAKMPWGIPVPGDAEHVMYVWFDALVNYITTIGWPRDDAEFKRWWPVTQFAGKDQVRQQAAIWQAMLMSAGLTPSKQIFIHGFITSDGQKMSKSLGNAIDPFAIVKEYGTDALRYFLLRHVHPFEDSDFTMERFKEAYNADLANGLGNLVARVMKLSEDNTVSLPQLPFSWPSHLERAMETFQFHDAMGFIWQKIQSADRHITEDEPFKVVKTDAARGKAMIQLLVREVFEIGKMLEPFMPVTSSKILEVVSSNKKPDSLFPRKE